ncbi:MAG: MFS transporter [Opitutales bacterium]|nr:MFS transporter [Opitutales bacterium]
MAASAFFFLLGFGFSCWATRISDIQLQFGLNDAELGSMLLLIPIGQFFTMPLSGFLVGKYGSKKVLALAGVVYPLSLIFLGLAAQIWQLYIGLFFFGVGGNLCNISMNTQAVAVEKYYGRSIMATFHGIWSLAGFAGTALSIFIVNELKLSPFEHFCLLGAAATFTLAFMRPFLVENDAEKPKPPRKTPFSLSAVKLDKYIVTLGFIAFCCMACEGTMFDWSVIYFRDVVRAPQDMIRYGFVAFLCCMATGRFTADKLVTKFGHIAVVMASGMLIVSGLSIAVVFPKIAAGMAGFALVGFGVSSVVPICYSLAGRSRTMSTGKALTGVTSIGFLGFLLGPPVIGYISNAFGLRWSFALIALVGVNAVYLAPKLGKFSESSEN